MLSNAYFLAKFRFDTAENEPAKNSQTFANFPNFANRPSLPRRADAGADAGADPRAVTRADDRADAGANAGAYFYSNSKLERFLFKLLLL